MSQKRLYSVERDAVFSGNNILDNRRFSFRMSVSQARFLLSVIPDISVVWDVPLTDFQEEQISEIVRQLVSGNTS